jgi:serine/threonine protein kinase
MDIIEKIGGGYYGEVFKCNHILPSGEITQIAAKRLKVNSHSEFTLSLRELEACRQLKHPHILTLLGFSNEAECRTQWPLPKFKQEQTVATKQQAVTRNAGGQHIMIAKQLLHQIILEENDEETRNKDEWRDDDICLLFELASCDLYALLEKDTLTELRAKRMIVQVLLALEYMHISGWAHRDIKPSNIVCFDNDRVKLCDLGLSKKYFRYDYHSPNVNTNCFKAPEILLSRMYGYASDIWALGCTYFYMLSKDFIAEFNSQEEQQQLQDIINVMPYNIDMNWLPSNSPLVKKIKLPKRPNTIDKFVIKCIRQVSPNGKIICYGLDDVDAYGDFLFSMLQISPRLRSTTTELLDSTYLSNFSSVISLTRSTNEFAEDRPITVLNTTEARECIKECTLEVFLRYRDKVWYRDKILFTSIELYDRLISIEPHEFNQCSVKTLKVYYKACLYIAIKYYLSSTSYEMMYSSLPFPEVSPRTPSKAKQIEECTLKILDYFIYNITCYDELIAKVRPCIKDVFSLLLFILDGNHNNMSSNEAYDKWETNKNIYMIKATKHKYWKLVLKTEL